MLSPSPQYRCQNLARARTVQQGTTFDGQTINGIDYLEVLDDRIPTPAPGTTDLRQRVLFLHLFQPVPAGITALDVIVTGGVRITAVSVVWVIPAATLQAGDPGNVVPDDEQAIIVPLLPTDPDALARTLVIRTDVSGDFSTYDLSLINHVTQTGGVNPPFPGFDEQLARVSFSFKVECATDFDCQPTTDCPTDVPQAPAIDYVAKDYTAFRSLMLDRMALTIPAWQERSPADIGVTVVELLAFAADQLSYFQDAVGNEAYLGTARQRPSMRRHARLLDYRPREGTNARTFVRLEVLPASAVSSGVPADGAELPLRTPLLTLTPGLPEGGVVVTSLDQQTSTVELAVAAGGQVFETMEPITLHAALDSIDFHTWGDEDCCLPKGATRATLRDPDRLLFPVATAPGLLTVGMVLALVEVSGPAPNTPADPAHRHVVRLTGVGPVRNDPLFESAPGSGQALQVVDVQWADADALPFPLCIRDLGGGQMTAVARGNVVLADHGQTISQDLPTPTDRFRPKLDTGPLTFQGQVTGPDQLPVPFDPTGPANAALVTDPQQSRPAIVLFPTSDPNGCDPDLSQHTDRWTPVSDLLESNPFAQEFVVETENDGTATLRFGDGTLGREPLVTLRACYRVGLGVTGNIGTDAISHVVSRLGGIESAANLMPATGGTEPESLDETRLSAPEAFRTQERAVTSADYADVAQRHPEVQRAQATRRFTGSWYTMFVAIDRLGGKPVDDAFRQEMADFLERFRLAGYDLEIEGAIPVPLDIKLTVCVKPGFFRFQVKKALLDALGSRDLPDGTRGFFHPDNFTFGQPVFLSRVIAAALAVPGVGAVDTAPDALVFKRLRQVAGQESKDGVLRMGRLEIAQLDNDPNRPENGTLELEMEGGA